LKTRFSSLVKIKKNKMQESETSLSKANSLLSQAQKALEDSYHFLGDIEAPHSGKMSQFLASRSLVASQRDLIQKNKEWVSYAQNQVQATKEQLKKDMIDYEKFNYLEVEEVKKIIKKQKEKESKDLDEIALITFGRKDNR
jgi:flagellar export protein FliJ